MRRSAWMAAVVAVATFATARAANDPPTKLDHFSWLAGSWASDSAGVRVEEYWTTPGGGLMLGMHRDLKGGKAIFFEFLRIVADEQGVAYLGMPGGRPATRFPLKATGVRSVTFEKADHDFPQRILYWLDDRGRLHARVEGTIRDTLRGENWCWRKQPTAVE